MPGTPREARSDIAPAPGFDYPPRPRSEWELTTLYRAGATCQVFSQPDAARKEILRLHISECRPPTGPLPLTPPATPALPDGNPAWLQPSPPRHHAEFFTA
jgi:hypothetical protein